MTHTAAKKKRDDPAQHQPDIGQKPVQLQRRRVWRACEGCRRKKIKCDGVEPVCAQCSSSNSQCTWLQTKDRAALSRHYVQELEARLMHMESLFNQITPVLEQMGHSPASLGLPTDPTSGSSLPSLPEDRSAGTDEDMNGGLETSPALSEPTVKTEDDSIDVSESFGQLTLDEHGHMRWIGGSSTMSLIQWFKAQTSSPLTRVSPMDDDPRAPGPSANKLYFPASVLFGKVRALPGPEEVEYPERDLADKLVDAYFSRLHYLLPVIDKPSFISKYTYLMENTRNIALHQSETAFISLVFAVFACAARLVDDPRLSTSGDQEDGGMGMVYYERAQILHYISHATIQVTHVQCFILMSSFLCSVNCLPQAWLLIGQAVRTAQDLGLHRSPRRLLCSPIEKETRRKIWWGVYTLDRMLAVALGRPLGVDDGDLDVELPVDIDDEQLPEYFAGALISKDRPSLMAGFVALTTLYKIAGRVLRQVYGIDKCRDNLEPDQRQELQRTVDALDKELTRWCDELPPVFKSNPINERDVSMGAVLCSHYYSILTTLHRNFLPVRREQPTNPRSVAKAVSSARACIRLAPSIRNVVPLSHHLAFFIQHLFSSAVIILLYAMHTHGTAGANVAMEEARSCLGALQSWEGYWPGARKCRELLQDLTQTATEAIRARNSTVPGQPPNTLAAAAAVPLPASPPLGPVRDRRPSITIAANAQAAHARGVVRNRPRRDRDRSTDPYMSRRHHATSPYRVDSAERARSSSRRRGHEDDAVGPSSPTTTSFSQSYSNMHYQPTGLSPHSSPNSMRGLPSPTMPVMESIPPLPAAQTVASNLTGTPPNFGLSPMHIPSPPRFDYSTFAVSPSQPNSRSPSLANATATTGSTPERWTGQGQTITGGASGLYSVDHAAFAPSRDTMAPADTTIPTFDTSASYNLSDGIGVDFPITPPYASFSTPGLPFRGLDFIRSLDFSNSDAFNDAGVSQRNSWPIIDGYAYDPDLAFNIGDFTNDTDIQNHAAAGGPST
ncbi:hypothetical protein PUNSTDRAFT_119596 [Punctularia strigosozonata HHB-11173 SS5]|uniref:uncharacterized protein n=1 Tax=Punctularia strigosozonata (strain HHB-11173) TaxID=741275 RepID=UPI000441754D|nr:uncharacterized protein PUNSTDRAFT_119596 [Punctularia strigosozonata HHB-11173 SS5]EIN10686.1 hypothetical protein PUNSTDRAFT_119596 [Punctularia strigosozonata HHB-11173 SS5]